MNHFSANRIELISGVEKFQEIFAILLMLNRGHVFLMMLLTILCAQLLIISHLQYAKLIRLLFVKRYLAQIIYVDEMKRMRNYV